MLLSVLGPFSGLPLRDLGFTNRLLDFMGTLPAAGEGCIPALAKADVRWFVTFLKHFNRQTLIWDRITSQVVCVVACPRGCGGIWWGKEYYRFVVPVSMAAGQVSVSSI